MSPVTQYIFDGTKWQNEVATARRTVAATTTTTATTTRKTGAKYVRYEDVYVSGDSLQKTIDRVTGNRVLTFPEGVFVIPPNFANGYQDGIRLGHAGWGSGCRGISGSGRNTIFKMLSSNRSQVTSGVNTYMLIDAVPRGADPMISVEFSNFRIQGTKLGADHDHNGLRLERCTNSLIENLYITGIRGSNKVPPGETGSISLQHCTNITVNNTEMDGRRDGVRVSSSLLMPNNSSGIHVNDCYFHHTYTGGGGIAWYYTTDGEVNNTRSEYIGSGPGQLQGYSFNHEESTRITYRNPVMVCDRNTVGGTLHMSLNSVGSGNPDCVLTVYNPKWDATKVGGGKFCVETWTVNGQVQRTPPKVYGADNSTPLPFYYINPYI